MIEIINAYKKYKNNEVFNIEYFKFNIGESYIIVGTNGSGKSTLIKCILSINNLSSGKIKLNSKNIGYVPEKYYFPEFCTIEKFLLSILELYNLKRNEKLIDYYCNLFKINKKKKISKLSKGMQQKTLIIQSLIHNADIYIFDEPLNGLDIESQKIFFKIIQGLKTKENTVLITTHYPKLYGKKYDHIIRIDKGSLINENN